MTDVQERPLMTTVDVSRVLRCSLQTVRRYERDGRLPAVRVGGLVRFKWQDVEALIDAGQPKDAA